jgi:hypothetical protein
MNTWSGQREANGFAKMMRRQGKQMNTLARKGLGEAWAPCGIGVCLILILACGCGPSPADTEFMKMVSETRERYRASEVRSAVLPLFSSYQTNGLFPSSVSNRIPRQIAELPLFAAKGSQNAVWAVGNTHGEPQGLAFVTGSGFGHWGIVVCPFENGGQAMKSLHGKVIPWGDGVYFFTE